MHKHLVTLALTIAMFFSLGAYVGHTLADTHSPLPACATEDAAGPCIWDATTQGNGHGRSFIVIDNEVTYLP